MVDDGRLCAVEPLFMVEKISASSRAWLFEASLA